MAIKNDYPGIGDKTQNEGTTDAGRLTHIEWNALVDAVDTVQTKVENTTNIKGILYKGTQVFNTINEDGYLELSPADPQGDVSITLLSRPKPYIASDADCKVTFKVSSKIQSTTGEGTESSEIPCKVKFYIDNGTGENQLVGSDTIYDYELSIPGVKKEITFDFAAQKVALAKGENIDNRLTIEVDNGYGKIIPAYVIVRVIDLSMTVENFDIQKVYNETHKPQVKVTVFGSDANVYAKVDGKDVLVNGETKAGVTKSFPISLFDDAGVNTHGVHTITLWAAVHKDVGNGETETISTKTVDYNYIYGTSSERPIVMANIANKTPEQYTVFNIAYVAYKYNASNAAITDDVKTSIYEINGTDSDGKPILGRELTYSSQSIIFDAVTNSASGSAALSLFPVNIKENPEDENSKYEEVVLIGEMAVVITIGDYNYVDVINIIPSSIQLNEVPEYAVRLSSAGRSNTEAPADKKTWESVGVDLAGNPLITNVTFDSNIEFEDTGSGWIADGDKYDINDPNDTGNIALRLRKGRFCTLNYNPFKVNPTFNAENNSGTGDGMTISIEFATRNALNQNASVISCLANDSFGKPRGFEVLANKATIYSKSNTLFADFKEDTRIRLDFVIDGKQWPYSYDTVWTEDNGEGETVEKKDTEHEALAIIYVDGVYAALALIPAGDSYLQPNGGVPIRFGSDECDVDIYNIRIYDKALTPVQIVQNYAYDTPNVKNKLAIAQRNQNVLTIDPLCPQKPNINIEGLRIARPELPFFYVEMDTDADPSEVLPKNKKDWKLMKTTQYKNPVNTNSQLNGNASFEIPFGVMRNQGTSSMTYPWPWRNWDWKTGDDIFPQGEKYYYIPTMDDPHAIKTKYWAQYKGMDNISNDGKGNIRKITLKKDYASSEMCNNAICSEMFTDMAMGIADAVPNVLSLAQRESGGKNSPYRLTFVAQPCFMFRKYSDTTKEGTAGKGYEALGMMNLIPNKNECAYLGFFDKWVWDPKNDKRAQSWELSDNYPEYFWKQEIKTLERINDNGDYINHIKGYYEARYPKDTTVFFKNDEADGDFGMVTPKTVTVDEAADVADEQKDLVVFHNWLVSTNRQIPVDYKKVHGEYRDLDTDEIAQSWNVSSNGQTIYYKDTPEYRLAKFKAEADDHMIVDQFALYYVWRETFWAYDSGLKNLQIYTMGPNPKIEDPDINTPMQWGCMVRDADTTLGIQNQGRIEFPPYLEDTDYYTEDSDGNKIWHFDALINSFDEEDINDLKGKHILNGQLASLWINLRDAFGENIEKVYNALSANSQFTNWNSGKAIKRFRDHQEKWCESLYNWGMRQYFGGEPFSKWINSGLGDKKNSRASWLSQAFYYRDSKYRVLSDYSAIRAGGYKTPDFEAGNTNNQSLKFKLYQPAYLLLAADEIDAMACKVHRRVADVSDYIDINITDDLQLPHDFSSAMNVMYGTNNMIEIGDLARVCKVFDVQAWQFPKLKSLLLGKDPDRGGDGVTYYEYDVNNNKVPISNTNLKAIDLSTFKQLQILDITNHTALGNFSVKACTELKELYATGCNMVRSIDLPNTTTLETIYLPYTMSSIVLRKLSGIKKFKLATPDEGDHYGISSLTIDNCGSYMAAESYNIVKQVLASLETAYHPVDNNNVCELSGIKWLNAENAYITRLLDINAKLSGHIHIVDTLNNDLKVRLVNAYGDIDNPDNGLYVTYVQTPLQTVSLPSKMYIFEEGITELSFRYTPSGANTYSHADWSLSLNDYATIDKATGVITRNSTTANETTPYATLKVKVYQIADNDGYERPAVESNESKVYFYERHAKPGDIVYHDGSFSDEVDKSKTAIGVCFYVDPDNIQNRLMVALQNISANQTNIGSFKWGIGSGSRYGNNQYIGSPQLDTPEDYGFTTMNQIINITAISDITNHGGDVNVPVMLNDDVYRNGSASNDYFTLFDFNSCLGNIGFNTASTDIEIDHTNVIVKDETYPIGYINTMGMIQRRNTMVAYFNDLQIPVTSGKESEYYKLFAKIADVEANVSINNWIGHADTYMYPAASLCYAYEPGGEGTITGLNDKFKKRKWFIPTAGDVARIAYYMRQYEMNDSDKPNANAFKLAIESGLLKTNGFYKEEVLTSTEYGTTVADAREKIAVVSTSGNSISTTINGVTTYSGICKSVNKYYPYYLRAICRF